MKFIKPLTFPILSRNKRRISSTLPNIFFESYTKRGSCFIMEDSGDWLGCSMEEIYRNLSPFELKHGESVKPSDNHVVLYHFPIKQFDIPPKPLKSHLKWDAYHVRLPCSNKSQYPVTKDDGNTTIESRWEMIEKSLLQPIKNSYELEKAILSYNSKYENYWKFRSLHAFFKEMEDDEATIFFDDLLPKIIQLALRLPELISTGIPLLKQNENRSVTLSQQQISCLLANAFLCTYPRRNTTKSKSEYSTFPDINFNRLFQSTGNNILEKLKCIFNYFRRITTSTPLGVVTFTRRSVSVDNLPNWSSCAAPLAVTPLHITSVGTIEDQGIGLLQVDFANKYLGGGVLGLGCVQEEIRFVICPELLISKLFTEKLRPNEALLMIGAEQYSKYTGYASTFQWDGDYFDKIPFDESRRKQCHIVAIDALHFFQSQDQYLEELILRELNKAYVGFLYNLDTAAPGIASGNWGCGAFGGDAKLKALIQLMACTVTKRPLVYFTFGNEDLRNEIHKMHTYFIEENVKVCELFDCLKEFGAKKLKNVKLYDFVKQCRNEKLKGSSGESSTANSVKLKRNNNKMIQSLLKISKRSRLPETSKNLSTSIVDLDDEIIPELENDLFNNTLLEKSDENISQSLLVNQSKDLFDYSFNIQEEQVIRSDVNNVQATKKIKKALPSVEKEITENKVQQNVQQTNQSTLIQMLDFFYDKN